ncbi:MAG: hypothetical protein JXQ75_21145 [Phycisphaerae bacterium]|nr:hypothetical protein [Phycisphaerae bacterium]
MNTTRYRRLALLLSPIVVLSPCLLGCEGIDRRHDPRVADIQPPPEDAPVGTTETTTELADFPDIVERVSATRESLLVVREQYFDELRILERAYLQAGDTVRANWARRQRERLEEAKVEPYPYLTNEPPEYHVEAAPEQLIPDADAIYNEAMALLNQVRGIPLAGHLEGHKKKAQQALNLFKRVLRDYPTSDKVDDCAFYCGEIYKEYLRDDDPDNELAIRYYKWAFALDPRTPHAARFQCAVVYDYRRHDRASALELYHQVLDSEEDGNMSNMRWAASRIKELTDDDASPLRPRTADRVVTPASDLAEPDGNP